MSKLLRTSGIGAAAVLAAALVVAVPSASEATPVSACGSTLTGPGSYELVTDLSCPGAVTALTITGPDVHLDLGGHTVAGDLTDAGRGIRALTATNFSLTNGTVTGFTYAVDVRQSDDGHLTGLTINGGGTIASTFGIYVRETTDTLVEGNTITGYYFAFELTEFALRNTLRDNRVVGNEIGLDMSEDVSENLFEDNDFLDSVSNNVQVGDDTLENVFRGNRMTGAGEWGFDNYGTGFVGNLLEDNRIRDNDLGGLDLARNEGVNTFRRNVIQGNGVPTGGVDIRDEWAGDDICLHTWTDNVFETDNEGDGPGAGCVQGLTPTPLVASTGVLPAGTVGTPYAASLGATGGLTPYTWSIAAGGLPAGLSLSPSGALSGTPTAVGSSSFTVTVTDDWLPPHTAQQTLSITVAAAPVTPPPVPKVRCTGRLATIVGTAGADTLVGTAGDDVIVAGSGADRVAGRGGNDVVCGGAGSDRLRGGGGDDRLVGGDGRDRVRGNGGSDRLRGDAGRDVLAGGADDDRLGGGRGRDDCRGGAGTDTASGCEVLATLPSSGRFVPGQAWR